MYHVFDLAGHVHFGNWPDYSYKDIAILIVDGKEIRAVRDDILSNNSHHPRALIKFPLIDEQGNDYITAETEEITLVLEDLWGVPERKFTWQLPLS